MARAATPRSSSVSAAARPRRTALKKVEAELLAALARAGPGQHDVRTVIDERGLVVSLVSRHVVFEPDVADAEPARPAGRGHPGAGAARHPERAADRRSHEPGAGASRGYYATDWDLSAARAVTVLRRLNELHGVPQTRLSASAFGHERPLIDPSLPGSQEINKRVDIVVLPATDAASSQLIDDVIDARPGAHEGVEG